MVDLESKVWDHLRGPFYFCYCTAGALATAGYTAIMAPIITKDAHNLEGRALIYIVAYLPTATLAAMTALGAYMWQVGKKEREQMQISQQPQIRR